MYEIWKIYKISNNESFEFAALEHYTYYVNVYQAFQFNFP